MEGFYTCFKCDAVMNPTEVQWSEIMECHCQFYECPNCGEEDYDTITD